MIYKFGFILALATAACSLESIQRRDTTELPKVWTMYATPPETELIPRSEITPSEAGAGQGRPVIVGYKPLYGYLDEENPGPELSADWDFKCPKRFGYFKYAQNCDIYVECRNYVATRKVCPDGMHFKRDPTWSEYPCAYPPEATCLARETQQPARPTYECPHQFGNYPVVNEKYSKYELCSSYISCSSGIAHLMNCTFGLVFNPEISLCDWPENVPSCRDAYEFRCPVPHLGEEDMVINYRYPNDPECRYFYSCLNGGYRVLACDEGLLFDYRIGRCVEYDNFVCDYKETLIPTTRF